MIYFNLIATILPASIRGRYAYFDIKSIVNTILLCIYCYALFHIITCFLANIVTFDLNMSTIYMIFTVYGEMQRYLFSNWKDKTTQQ